MNPFVLKSFQQDTQSNHEDQFSTAAERKPQKLEAWHEASFQTISPWQFRRLDGMEILIHTVTGEMIRLAIKSDDSIEKVKAQIQGKEGILRTSNDFLWNSRMTSLLVTTVTTRKHHCTCI